MKSIATAAAWSPGSRGRGIVDFQIGDIVRLRKAHPCGADEWEVVRLGADIGLRCLGCNRRVLLERAVLERRMKEIRSGSASAVADELAPSRFLRPDQQA